MIFRLPRDTRTTLIKRVIGLPGDRVQMVHGRLVINGAVVPLEASGTGKVEEADGHWREIGKFTETELEYWTAVIRKAGITGELQ